MDEFYMNLPEKIFYPDFLGGGACRAPMPAEINLGHRIFRVQTGMHLEARRGAQKTHQRAL